MSYDPVDVWEGAVGSLFKRLLLFVSAVWAGSLVAAMSLVIMGAVAGHGVSPQVMEMVFIAPVVLLSEWFFVNFAILVIAFAYFIRSDRAGYRAWMILAGLISIMGMLGQAADLSSRWIPRMAGWISWLVLLGMLATGVWMIRQFFINRWALQLAAVQAENSVREAHAESLVLERLEASRPPEPSSVIKL